MLKKPGKQKGSPKTGGRVKGTPNKVSGDLRAMVHEALNNAGGVEYLTACASSHTESFLALLGKTLPKIIQGDAENPLVVALQGVKLELAAKLDRLSEP